jgi:hypothetical protein
MGESAEAYLAAIVGFGYNNPWFNGTFCSKLKITSLVLFFIRLIMQRGCFIITPFTIIIWK